MSDYEAAFESVMKYMRADVGTVDTQEKLERFLRQNDRRNVMSENFIEKLSSTRGADELINDNKENKATSGFRLQSRASRNDAAVSSQSQKLRSMGIATKGTYTDKRGDRHSVITNAKGQTVAVYSKSDGKLQGRELKAGKPTGKFASLR